MLVVFRKATSSAAPTVVFLKARRYRDQPGYRLERKRWHAITQDGVALGGGGEGRAVRMTLPSSDGLATQEEARTYWLTHFGGKTVSLTVHSGGKALAIQVRFPLENDHAYTSAMPGQKTGKRTFDVERAMAMARIPQVIEFPQRRLRDGHTALLLEQRLGSRYYTIVLTWESGQIYRFSSAHFKTIQEVAQLFRRQTPHKSESPL